MPTGNPAPQKLKWQDVRRRLAARLERVEAEILDYPMPITACDAQYNHLLELRRAIALEIGRARDAEAVPGADPAGFVTGCRYLEETLEV